MEINLEDLAKFLVKAKKACYAGGGKEVEKDGFKELEYAENNLCYSDRYIGYYSGQGNEIVRLSGQPIWMMSFQWKLRSWAEKDAEKIFSFLRENLSKVEEKYPFRGPIDHSIIDERRKYRYHIDLKPRPSILSVGNLEHFIGTETIVEKISNKSVSTYLWNKPVYEGNFFGGLIKSK